MTTLTAPPKSTITLDNGSEVELTIDNQPADRPIVYDETMRFANGMRVEKAEADFIRANPRLMERMQRSTP